MGRVNSVWLWLTDDEHWERFNREETALIEREIALDNKGVVLERNGTTYFLDLLRFTQTSARTGRRRPIYQVKVGAEWLMQHSRNSDKWELFSRSDTQQLENAFFNDNQEFTILNENQYVDFSKWTVTDLNTGTLRYFKISRMDITSNEDPALSSPLKSSVPLKRNSITKTTKSMKPTSTSSVRQSSSLTSSASSRRNSGLKKPQLVLEFDESERTATTASEEPLMEGGDASFVNRRRNSATSRRNSARRASSTNAASWRWHNDSESWSAYDDDVTAAIERSWESGAPEMMFTRASTPYFIDLRNLTQTNVATGHVRAIQRVQKQEDWDY